MIQRYMFRYPYHFCNCDSESDALDIVKERIKKDSISTLKAEIEKSQNEFKKLKAQQQLLFKEVNSQEVQQIAYVLQQFALLRFELKNCWAGIHYSLFPLFRHIAQATGQTIGDVMMYWSMKDILTFFETKIAVDKEEIKQRKKFYLFLLENNTISFWVGDEAKKTKGAILERDLPKHVSSFEGSVACRGKTTGIVKIISFDDIRIIEKTADGIKQDFILVTGMTNPNMVPLIKKAKAIVTDEGGITCHAAIISREFNIPCIVGTKIATQVLKDGDVVEVNAYDGIVRKIK
ncbi:hypothetical protein J4207_01380 [Candidatus Woesearchaeota archaeon]|nr:hypothetical protein [Candidatus Woesearchaeota archaeon]